ncbi:16926_t:CDS:2 [Acaulospora colombiana]|uniref:16926_t:CDS:1 n=1 Tax=Acaulospora colombiana TaxID=27376 RepID=A0ACA9MUW0_9GLOM|nr:16926_t:CDS:2 [Acaulospora colombiana]
MSPNKARKKKHVYAKFSKPRNGPMGFDEERLPYNASVRYLLNPGELEGGRRRITDYENGDGPERSFVREQLMVVKNVEYPPRWILRDQY